MTFSREQAARLFTDAIFLTRSSPSGEALAVDAGTGATLLSVTNMSFDVETGLKIRIDMATGLATSAGIAYFGLDSATETQLTGAANLNVPWIPTPNTVTPIAPNSYINSSRLDFAYSSQLHNAELNFKWRTSPSCQLVHGVRYLNLNEDFDINSINPGPSPNGTALYHIETENHLIGYHGGWNSNNPISDQIVGN